MCSLLFAFSQDRLEHLRKQCGPHVTAVAKDSVEGICTKIYHISAEYVRRIRQAHLNLLKECNITGKTKLKTAQITAHRTALLHTVTQNW